MSVDEPGMLYLSIVATSMWAMISTRSSWNSLATSSWTRPSGGVLALLLPEVGQEVVEHEVLQPDRRSAALGRDLGEEIEIAVTQDLGELRWIGPARLDQRARVAAPPVLVDGIAEECHPRSLVLGEVAACEMAVLEVRLDAPVEPQPSPLDQVGAVEPGRRAEVDVARVSRQIDDPVPSPEAELQRMSVAHDAGSFVEHHQPAGDEMEIVCLVPAEERRHAGEVVRREDVVGVAEGDPAYPSPGRDRSCVPRTGRRSPCAAAVAVGAAAADPAGDHLGRRVGRTVVDEDHLDGVERVGLTQPASRGSRRGSARRCTSARRPRTAASSRG